METPTVGQIVMFHPGPTDSFPDTLQAAIVARVAENGSVTLMVIDPNGRTFPKEGVPMNDNAGPPYAEFLTQGYSEEVFPEESEPKAKRKKK